MASLQKGVRNSLENTRRIFREGIAALESYDGFAKRTEHPNGASYSLRNPKTMETCSNIKHEHVNIFSGASGSKLVFLYTALSRLERLLDETK